MIQDESDGFEDTWRFLDHQVQGVHHVSIRPIPHLTTCLYMGVCMSYIQFYHHTLVLYLPASL